MRIDSVASPAWGGYSPGKATFALRRGSLTSSYRIQTFSVSPGGVLSLAVTDAPEGTSLQLTGDAGVVSTVAGGSWNWRAPETPGLYLLRVVRSDPPDTIAVNAFVTVPASRMEGEYLNGYRIGAYPPPPRPIYRRPEGFIEVTPQILDVWVSPHFRLRQFLCKQKSGYPKYLVLDPLLLHKLEILLEQLNAAGYHARTFNVLSGFRTPDYNRAIGNVPLSRHVWGAAADVFVDEDGDGHMDDLNGDGRRDVADARLLYGIADALAARADYRLVIGGLGVYRANNRHGPYLHVDVRGRRARWSR
jgi:hypothetical protein